MRAHLWLMASGMVRSEMDEMGRVIEPSCFQLSNDAKFKTLVLLAEMGPLSTLCECAIAGDVLANYFG
jgi:hypothetical protein